MLSSQLRIQRRFVVLGRGAWLAKSDRNFGPLRINGQLSGQRGEEARELGWSVCSDRSEDEDCGRDSWETKSIQGLGAWLGR